MFIVVRTYVFINDAQRLCDHNGPREVQTKPRQVCFYVFAPSTTCSIHQRPEGYQIQVPPATEEGYQIQVPLVPDAHLFSL